MALDNMGGLTDGQRQYDADKAREAAEFAAFEQRNSAAFAKMGGGTSAAPATTAPTGGGLQAGYRAMGANGGDAGYRAMGSEYRQDPEYAVWKATQDAIREGARGGRGTGSLASKVLGGRWGNSMSGGLSAYDMARVRTGSTTSAYDLAKQRISGAVNGPVPAREDPTDTPMSAAPGQAAYRVPSFYDNKIPPGKGLTSPESGITMTAKTRQRYGIKPQVEA